MHHYHKIIKHIKKFANFLNENINLSNLIKTVREEFINGDVCSYEEINNGSCVDFVDEIEDRFSDNFETLTTSIFIPNEKTKKYLISKYNDEMLKYGDIEWSKNMLDEYGYPSEDLMNEEPPNHIWIYYNGKHYDAEEPNGVENPWNLPIFNDYNWF